MMHELRYGESETLQLEVPPEVLVADCTQVPGPPLEEPDVAATAALLSPVYFPPLPQAVVPGDRVVIALDPEVPQAGRIVAGVVQALLATAIPPDHITVLQACGHDHAERLAAQLPPGAQQVQFAVHDPRDAEQLAYLAASKDAAPIHVNRLLCDADLVLPINLLRPDTALLYAGPHGGLCPTYSGAETQQRFRTPNAIAPRAQQRRRREEADEVAWLLGIQLSLQVIAGAGDNVLHVLAGMDQDVTGLGRALVDAAWGYEVPRRAELVIATIEGEPSEQSWENFGRALHAAQQLCDANGTIVLCTELSCKPGHALRRLASFEEKEKLLKRIGNERSADALAAWLLLEARDASHVFLLSQLEEAVVESLGIGYIDSADHIDRIRRQFDSCILLGNAHRAALQVG
jgi:nickel-dependent lactate racemase